MNDYYETLGVSRGVSEAELKKAYRKAAHECHPDKYPDDKEKEERFKEISEAYSVLSDAGKRARYDQFGNADGPDPSQDFGFDINDMVNQFFGGRQRRAAPGADVHETLELDFLEVARGCQKHVTYKKAMKCSTCEGKGGEGDPCGRCSGAGFIRQQVRSPFGVSNTLSFCQNCSGTGVVIKKRCKTCQGRRQVPATANIELDVREGTSTDTVYRFPGLGSQSLYGSKPGDLYVKCVVKDHDFFQRHGNNVVVEVPVTVSELALGCEKPVQTIDSVLGRANPLIIHIRPGADPKKPFEFTAQGLQNPNVRPGQYNQRGNQIVRLAVQIPEKLTDRQRELFEELQRTFEEQDDQAEA